MDGSAPINTKERRMATVLDILVVVDEQILTSPQKWTRQANARTASGKPTDSTDPSAARFCLLGAVHRASDMLIPKEDDYGLELHALQEVGSTVGIRCSDVTDFNDASKFADVKLAIQRTIARLRR
jgi:hypothetical protein